MKSFLSIRKKILSFLLVFFLVFFLWPREVLATDAPTCDPTQVDLSNSSNGSNCDGWLLPGSQSKCDNNAPGTVFCNAGPVTGWVGSPCCWPKGVTTSDPTCPGGMNTMVSCGDICCMGMGIWPAFACNEKSGAPSPAIRDCAFIQQWAISWTPKNVCPNLMYRYNKDTKKCERFVEKKWDLIQDCGNKITVIVNGVGHDHYDGVSTAIGCVPVENLTDFLKFVLKWVFFASGGIIVLMVIATGYTLITSQGNPEKLQGAKENIVALLSGLAMIAFSLILLQVIGANILGLPTF